MLRYILQNIHRLPNPVNLCMLALNRNPVAVFGSRYKAYCNFLCDTEQQYDPLPKLLERVNYAIARVPYYRQRYGERIVKSIADFEERIAFIDKDMILANYSEFMAEGLELSDYDTGTTGGTSGKPLQLIAPRDRYVVEMATMHSLWKRAGYSFDPRAVIRNHKLADGKVFIVNPVTREIIFDGFRLEPEYFEHIYRIIRKRSIRFIHCYPSAAYEFSSFLLTKGYDTAFIKAFLSGSENIFDYQIDLIQNRLGIRFYNWYGHSEKLILAGYCGRTNIYHVEPTYGYFELIDENNRVIREPGKCGEMVGTGFHNPGMVFIRYRTGDFAEYAGDYCPSCKRHVTLLRNIRGRWSGDKLFNKDGTYLTTTALNLHNDLYAVINGMQYVQDKKGEVKIFVVKSPQYEVRHEQALYRHFRGKFKPETDIQIQYVDKLSKLPNGKFVHIISKVKDQKHGTTRTEAKERSNAGA